jgi:integrase
MGISPELRRMALFAVNTGCRNEEVCNLRWECEIPILRACHKIT